MSAQKRIDFIYVNMPMPFTFSFPVEGTYLEDISTTSQEAPSGTTKFKGMKFTHLVNGNQQVENNVYFTTDDKIAMLDDVGPSWRKNKNNQTTTKEGSDQKMSAEVGEFLKSITKNEFQDPNIISAWFTNRDDDLDIDNISSKSFIHTAGCSKFQNSFSKPKLVWFNLCQIKVDNFFPKGSRMPSCCAHHWYALLMCRERYPLKTYVPFSIFCKIIGGATKKDIEDFHEPISDKNRADLLEKWPLLKSEEKVVMDFVELKTRLEKQMNFEKYEKLSADPEIVNKAVEESKLCSPIQALFPQTQSKRETHKTDRYTPPEKGKSGKKKAAAAASKRKQPPTNQVHVYEKQNETEATTPKKPTKASTAAAQGIAQAKKKAEAAEEQVYEDPMKKAPLQGKSDEDSQDEITLGGPGEGDEAEGDEAEGDEEDEDSSQE